MGAWDDGRIVRVAVVSDIHGNLTAFEAVIKDLADAAPDVVMHGGDLADGGSSPVEIVDRIRELGWRGVMGNTDEMLVRPEALEAFASQSAAPIALWAKIREIATATRAVLGAERLEWMSMLPRVLKEPALAVVHASPASCWHAPAETATEAELLATYGGLNRRMVIFGHTHRPGIRRIEGSLQMVVNAGSVGLSYDGDRGASYALIDGNEAVIRRVEYDLDRELKMLATCGLPGAEWTAKMLRAGGALMP